MKAPGKQIPLGQMTAAQVAPIVARILKQRDEKAVKVARFGSYI